VMKEAVPNPSVKPAPAVVASVTDVPAPPPIVPAPVNEVKLTTKPVAAHAATTTAAVTPAATNPPQTANTSVPPVTAAKQPEKAPITIRRAILPSKEEIDRMKQGQVESRTGQMPAISTAAPLPPKRKETP